MFNFCLKATVLLCALACVCGKSFLLSSSISLIPYDVSIDVILDCRYSLVEENAILQNPQDNDVTDVIQMRILKLEDGLWEEVMIVDPDWESPFTHFGVLGSVLQQTSEPDTTIMHVQARWLNASSEAAGTYTCDLTGYTRSNHITWLTTPQIVIEEEQPLHLRDVNKKAEMAYEKINETYVELKQLLSEQGSLFNVSATTTGRAIEKAQDEIGQVRSDLDIFTTSSESQLESMRYDLDNFTTPTTNSLTSLRHDLDDFISSITKEFLSLQNDYNGLAASSEEQLSSLQSEFEEFKRATNSELEITAKENRDKAIRDHEAFESLNTNIQDLQESLRESRQENDALKDELESTKHLLNTLNASTISFRNETERKLHDYAEENVELKEFQLRLKELFEERGIVDALEELTPKPKPALPWPQGIISLLQPETGCPPDFGNVTWVPGYLKHHTESTNKAINNDYVSEGSHLKGPVKERSSDRNNFMTQHICSLDNSRSYVLWPAGRYCIMGKYERPCPNGFSAGTLKWDDEDDENKNERFGMKIYDEDNTSNMKLKYCCRNDAAPSVEVTLPTTAPFYLFRYAGGPCQTVKNMTVTEEEIFFDNENDRSNTIEENAVPDEAVTDGKDVRLHLCYYR